MKDCSLSVFQQILGEDYDQLPAIVRQVHGQTTQLALSGKADAEISLGRLGHLICWIMGFPKSGKAMPVSIDFIPNTVGGVKWIRSFGGRQYASHFSAGKGRAAGRLIEQMGLITAVFVLEVQRDRLKFDLDRCRLLGLALPRILCPKCIAYESEQDGAFVFDIILGLPFLGRLIAYRGNIR
jgi:hypothetical protein